MARKRKDPVVKTCPKCGKEHNKERAVYCSQECANSRKWTDKQKLDKSIAKRKAIMADTDEAEEERLRVLSNKKVPPPIVHPDDGLQPNQFSDGEDLWNVVDPSEWGDGYY